MKRLFLLASAAVLFGTSIIGCQNTAQGAAEDTTKNAAAVEKGAADAANKTVVGAEKAGAAVEKGAAEAGAAVEKGAAQAGAAVEKGAAETAKAVGQAGQVVTHTGKVLTVTPAVKTALLNDNTLYPKGNANLNNINVDTGSDGQTIVLKGTVQTNEMKKHAEEVAKKASPDASYKIDNQLTVEKH